MTTTLNTFGERLAAALDLGAKAAPYVPSPDNDSPFAGKTIAEIAGDAGFPALNMAAKTNGAPIPQAMEESLFETRAAAKDAKAAARQAQARARAAKKVEFDRIASLDVTPDPVRMTQAWCVVFPLVPIVTAIANEKKRWAERFLGSVVDDVAQVVLERMAIVLAKSDNDLLLLARAAAELGDQAKRNAIPGDQMTDEQRADRKAMGKARKWLMGMVNNRVQGTLTDLYAEARNLRSDNIDIVTSVMASINGIGGDPLVNAHKASRAPGFLGTRFQRPDGIDQGLVAAAINAAITDRGLDMMVELLLNDDNRRTDGSVAWSRIAEDVFLATPLEVASGTWLWSTIVKATDHHAKPKRARADAARTHVRNLFEWLPGFVVSVVNSMDLEVDGWAQQPQTRVHAAPDADHTVTRVIDVRFITGTSTVAARKSAFDGATDANGVEWPLTQGLPVGDGVAAEFADLETVQMPWRFRQNATDRPHWRPEAVLTSVFESYLPEADVRRPFVPSLVFATVEEAAEALTRHLDVLTGADLVTSIVNA